MPASTSELQAGCRKTVLPQSTQTRLSRTARLFFPRRHVSPGRTADRPPPRQVPSQSIAAPEVACPGPEDSTSHVTFTSRCQQCSPYRFIMVSLLLHVSVARRCEMAPSWRDKIEARHPRLILAMAQESAPASLIRRFLPDAAARTTTNRDRPVTAPPTSRRQGDLGEGQGSLPHRIVRRSWLVLVLPEIYVHRGTFLMLAHSWSGGTSVPRQPD